LRAEIDAVRASGETQRVALERAAVERSVMGAALRTYADSASTVRAVLADLEAEEARVAEARRRTFSDARQMLERAERRSSDATEVEASVREPSVKIAAAKVIEAAAERDAMPTPLSTPRAQRAVATTAVALPRARIAAAVPPSRGPRPVLAGAVEPEAPKKT
jgi:hypothetical protein